MPQAAVCDGQKDCFNTADEDLCAVKPQLDYSSPEPPAIVRLSRRGGLTVHALNQSQLAAFSPALCPPTHFKCPGQYIIYIGMITYAR